MDIEDEYIEQMNKEINMKQKTQCKVGQQH